MITTPNALKIASNLLSYRPRLLTLTIEENRYLLIRLTSDDYHRLRKNSLPIEEDGLFMMKLESMRTRENKLNLAQAFVVLESLFGESGHLFDDYKGSFVFPLFMSVHKNGQEFPYLLSIRDYKGSLEFPMRRVIDANDNQFKRDVYHKPFADEFSQEEINEFTVYFYGFLEGYLEAIAPNYNTPFFRTIRACFGIYGYQNGEFFEYGYETEEDFEEAIAELKSQIS